jgi:sorting nexin-1/2
MGLPSIQPPRDDEESADYLKARAYFWELEGHLSEAHRQAERLVRHHSTLAAALSDFSLAMAALGRTQDTAEEAGFDELASQANAVAGVCRRSSENLAKSFEAPMKEFMRSVRAAKKAMLERSDALAARNAARADVEARRARLTRLRSTPGMKEERVMEAERELDDSLKRSEAAARAYSAIVQRLDTDLIRFQRERARDIGMVLKEFAGAEAAATAEMARLWGNAT